MLFWWVSAGIVVFVAFDYAQAIRRRDAGEVTEKHWGRNSPVDKDDGD